MARVTKFTDSAVVNQIRHLKRQIKVDRNTDIDPERTPLNFSLTPDRGMNEIDYYRKRKSELYCYGRSDLNTMAQWVVTAPREIESYTDIKRFLEAVFDFLCERYGPENVISCEAHFDEGKTEKLKDRWTGNVIKDKNGKPKRRLVLGRPHLHFSFIPVVPDKKPKHNANGFYEKICANDLLNPIELQHFHQDLAQYLRSQGIKGEVLNGSTKAQGRNYTVAEMKERYEMKKELERLREIERKYNMEHDRNIEKGNRW